MNVVSLKLKCTWVCNRTNFVQLSIVNDINKKSFLYFCSLMLQVYVGWSQSFDFFDCHIFAFISIVYPVVRVSLIPILGKTFQMTFTYYAWKLKFLILHLLRKLCFTLDIACVTCGRRLTISILRIAMTILTVRLDSF